MAQSPFTIHQSDGKCQQFRPKHMMTLARILVYVCPTCRPKSLPFLSSNNNMVYSPILDWMAVDRRQVYQKLILIQKFRWKMEKHFLFSASDTKQWPTSWIPIYIRNTDGGNTRTRTLTRWGEAAGVRVWGWKFKLERMCIITLD